MGHKKELNLSEAYTEFMSVLLYIAYQSIHYAYIKNVDIYVCFCTFLCFELKYSLYLSSSILKFFNYDHTTYYNFFKDVGEKYDAPIPIWEYVILRTLLMLNLDTICQIIDDSWLINDSNINNIVNLMTIDDVFIKKMDFFIKKTDPIANVSYVMIDLNWNLI